MSQGKAFTKEQKEEIINSLKTYLQLGYSRNKACELVGLTPQTLSLWIKADEALLMKIKSWENEINVLARTNWRNAIQKDKDLLASQKWLEARERNEFGKNVDLTSGGEKLDLTKVIIEIEDGSTENGTEN